MRSGIDVILDLQNEPLQEIEKFHFIFYVARLSVVGVVLSHYV